MLRLYACGCVRQMHSFGQSRPWTASTEGHTVKTAKRKCDRCMMRGSDAEPVYKTEQSKVEE
jgi:hypothetical protein